VANGTWSVGVSCQGGSDSLDTILGSGTYQCPGQQGVIISNINSSANFTVQQCNGIQVQSPTNLPDGQAGVYYATQLSATTCSGNQNWSLNSGTLPPGFNLYGGGQINGTCSTTGTYNFNASVTDGFNTTNHDFSIRILQQVTPPTLANVSKSGAHFQFSVTGTAGQNYTIQAATNLGSTNWASILVTNPTMNTFIISDTNATNPARYYRVLLGP